MPCNKNSCSCDDSSYCKYKKYRCKKEKYCNNPYLRSSCDPCPPYNPCPTPYNPCPPYNPYNPCNPCNPCYQQSCSPCSQTKTYNPFMYPNYTIYSGTTSITIPSVASATNYIYSMCPGSSTSLTVTLPLISSLDCSKKRNFIIVNSGQAGCTVTINAYNNTDTFNGQSGTPATMSLSPGESAQFFSDGATNNWIIINGVPPA